MNRFSKILPGMLITIIFAISYSAFAQAKTSDLRRIDELLSLGKHSEVIELCKHELTLNGIKSKNTLAHIHSSLALAYMYERNNQLAKTEAKKAISLDKTNHEAHWVLSNVYMAEGLNEEGSSEYMLSVKNPSKRPCKPCAKKKIDLTIPSKSSAEHQ